MLLVGSGPSCRALRGEVEACRVAHPPAPVIRSERTGATRVALRMDAGRPAAAAGRCLFAVNLTGGGKAIRAAVAERARERVHRGGSLRPPDRPLDALAVGEAVAAWCRCSRRRRWRWIDWRWQRPLLSNTAFRSCAFLRRHAQPLRAGSAGGAERQRPRRGAGRVHRWRRAPDRRADVISGACFSTTSRSGSTVKRCGNRGTTMRKHARCSRPYERCLVSERRERRTYASSTIWATAHVTLASCWSPTTPTRWTGHWSGAPDPASVAGGWGSWSLTHHASLRHRATPGVRQDVRGAQRLLKSDAPEPVHAGVDGEAVDLGPPLRVHDQARCAQG